MPLFDLECPSCQHRWEDMVRQNVIPACPKCGGADARKLPTIGFMAMADFVPAPGQRVELNLNPDGSVRNQVIGPAPSVKELKALEKK